MILLRALLAAAFYGAGYGILRYHKKMLISIGCFMVATLCLAYPIDLSGMVTSTDSKVLTVSDSWEYRDKNYVEAGGYMFVTDGVVDVGSKVTVDVDYVLNAVYNVKLAGASTVSEIPLRNSNGIKQSILLRKERWKRLYQNTLQ